MPFDSKLVIESAEEIALASLEEASAFGVDEARAEVSFDSGLSLGVREGTPEIVERSDERVLTLTVWKGSRRGCVSSSEFSKETLKSLAMNASAIADHAQADPCFGLPDEDSMQTEFPDLDLYNPFRGSIEDGLDYLREVEEAAFSFSSDISASDGIRLSTSEGAFVLADSRGFIAGYPYARHDLDCSLVAESSDDMQTDFSFVESRKFEGLGDPEEFGRLAARRTIAKLGARELKSMKADVLVDARAAVGLMDILEEVLSGRSLYRRLSCLQDKFEEMILPEHVSIEEDPYIAGAIGSGVFDDEGCRGSKRSVVERGVLRGAFLTSYSARRLGLKTTGNAGGAYNLILTSEKTAADDGLEGMLRKLWRGFYATEFIGSGFNPVTGEYSRGANGFWVENGRIVHPVSGVAVSGNIIDMMRSIEAVGSDVVCIGGRATGSHLLRGVTIAGR